MVTLSSAENALKTLYLGVVADQLNTEVNPLMAKIAQTTSDVWGKEIRKAAPFGINGGIGAGTEAGDLPIAAANNYAQFVLTLKNLYGTIEISDKAIRASQNSSGAFVNLLEAEMEGLLRASKFNFGRMLYGDGTGVLAKGMQSTTTPNLMTVDNIKNFVEGMVVDIIDKASHIRVLRGSRVLDVDRENSTIVLEGSFTTYSLPVAGFHIVLQNSYNNELTGFGKIFGDSETLYGVSRSENKWMTPYKKTSEEINDIVIQNAIDHMDEYAGSTADFIVCSSGVKRAYQDYLITNRSNIDVLDLKGGYKAISYNGIPVISDRFCPEGTMYILNMSDFHMHQLCDWRWLEDNDGRILKQVINKPVYNATLVKYADMICDRPGGQSVITGIEEK